MEVSRLFFGRERGVIPACDVSSLKQLKELVQLTCEVDGVVGYKVGFSLALRYGLKRVVETVREYSDLPVVYDHQKAGTDIPRMAEGFAEVCSEASLDGVIIFPLAGPETLKSFVEELVKHGLKPFVGAEMTHPKYLGSEGGFIIDEALERIYVVAAELGVDCFVVPGNKPGRISFYVKLLSGIVKKPVFCLPGIGKQGGDIVSAFKSTVNFPSYAIIGSAIYGAENIKEAAENFCMEALRKI